MLRNTSASRRPWSRSECSGQYSVFSSLLFLFLFLSLSCLFLSLSLSLPLSLFLTLSLRSLLIARLLSEPLKTISMNSDLFEPFDLIGFSVGPISSIGRSNMIRTNVVECSWIDWNGENDENISIDLCRVIYPVGVVSDWFERRIGEKCKRDFQKERKRERETKRNEWEKPPLEFSSSLKCRVRSLVPIAIHIRLAHYRMLLYFYLMITFIN